MKSFKIIIPLYLVGVTLLMINDYFSNAFEFLNIPNPVIIGLLIFLLFSSGIFVRKSNMEKYTLIWSYIFPTYFLFLVIVLTISGGTSTLGISLDNPIIWIFMIVSIFETKYYRKKNKEERVLQR